MTNNNYEETGLLRVTDAEYINDFTIKLEFNHKEWREVDFEPLMQGRHFYTELLEHKHFIQYAITMDTIEWYNGVDFSPDYLYANSKPTPKPYFVDDDSPLPTAAEEPAEYGE